MAAIATTPKASATSGLPRATRQPSAFHPTVKVTVLAHGSVNASDASLAYIQDVLTGAYTSEYAVRAVHRTRAAGGANKVPSLSVYLAPLGYEFAKVAERGVRLPSDVADLLRSVAASMGLDPNDSASLVAVAKALASKASAK